MFTLFDESAYHFEKSNESMSIVENTLARISYTQSDGLALASGVRLIPRAEFSAG